MSGKSLLSLSMGGVLVTAMIAVVGLSYIGPEDSTVGAEAGGVDKVTICHVPDGNPDNPQTITIGAPAVDDHLSNHEGDHLGPCEGEPVDGEEPDAEPGDGADVTVDKSANVTIDAGFGRDSVEYTIIVQNLGPGTALNVILEDDLPDDFETGWTLTGSGADDCALDGDQLECAFGDLESGDHRTIVVTSDLCEIGCGDAVVNTATVSADNDDNAENNEDTAVIERPECPSGGGGGGGGGTPPEADVSVSKDATVASDGPGADQVTYDITVSSIGALTATNVTLTDLLPNLDASWSLSGADAEDCDIDGDLLTCSFGDLGPGETRSISVQSSLCDLGCGEDIVNSVEVNADNDGNLANNEDTAIVERDDCPEITDIADVAVSKEGVIDNDTGDTHRITFFVTVESIGQLTAENVHLVDSLPDFNGLPWMVGGADSGDCSTIDRTIACDFGDLEPGEVREFHVWSRECELDCWDALTNTAEVSADNDGNSTNNFVSETVVLECPEDVGVEKTASSEQDTDFESSSDSGAFRIVVTSHGPFPATNAFLKDELPAFDHHDWTLSGDIEDCAFDGLNIECQWDVLPVGAVKTIIATAEACEIGCGPDIVNTAFVGSDHDDNPDNNQDSAIIEREPCPADVGVEKTGDLQLSDEAGADFVEFTITVTSNGPFAADNVVLTDHLPDLDGLGGWSTAGDDEDCVIENLTLECHFGTLDVGASRTVVLTSALCDIDCEAVIENEAWVSASNDTNPENDHDFVVLEAPECPGDVAVEKDGELTLSDEPGGDAIEFIITVSSVGNDTAQNVTLTDHLPDFGPWSIDGDVEGCDLDGNELFCEFGSLEPGETRTVFVNSALCDIDCEALIENEAWVDSWQDTNPDNNHDNVTLVAPECPGDVGVEKDGELSLSDEPGHDAVKFTITVTSVGEFTANNVTLTDHLPELGPWTLGGDSADCSIAQGTLTCSFGDLAPGESRTVTLTSALCEIECEAVFENEAWVSADNDENPENDHDDVLLVAPECPGDVAVEKTGELSLSDEPGGDSVEFTITVTSVGDFEALNVTLTDHLPDLGGGWTLSGDSDGCDLEGNELFCEFGTLEPGESRTVVVTSTLCDIDCEAVIENEAWVDASNDENEANNHDNVTLVAPECPGDVEVVKDGELSLTDGPGGDTVEFTITVTSVGDHTAENVVLTDHLPDLGASWTTSGDDEDCSITDGTLTCSFGDLAPGESRTVIVTSTLCDIDCEEVIVNEAWVSADNDENPENDHDTVRLEAPECPPDVSVEKTGQINDDGDLSQATFEDSVEFTITVTNIGLGPATNVVLTDTLPVLDGQPWSIVSGGEGCSIAGNELECSYGTLEPGASRTVTVESAVCELGCDMVIENTAFVTADDDVDTSNNSDTVVLELPPCPDVGVDKTVEVVDEGSGFETVHYTIVVTSVGESTAQNVVLTDDLPDLDAGWSTSGDDGSCSIDATDRLVCDFGDLAPGESRTVIVSSTLCDIGCGPDIVNTAFVDADGDVNASNDSDTAVIDRSDCPTA